MNCEQHHEHYNGCHHLVGIGDDGVCDCEGNEPGTYCCFCDADIPNERVGIMIYLRSIRDLLLGVWRKLT